MKKCGAFVALLLIFALAHLSLAEELSSGNASSGSIINESGNNTFVINADAMDADCALRYECKGYEGQYWFDCYYDFKDAVCRCSLGAESNCRVALSSFAVQQEADRITGSAVSIPYSGRIGAFFSSQAVQAFLLILVVALVIAVYLSRRDAPENNLRNAIRYHRLAEHYHNKGDGEKARHYYKVAAKYREKIGAEENVVEEA